MVTVTVTDVNDEKQAQCLLSRVGVVSLHARDAAKRRVADKKERGDRRDGKSNV